MAPSTPRLRSRPKPLPTRSRPRGNRVSYKEISSESDDISGSEEEYEAEPSSAPRRQAPPTSPTRTTTNPRKRKATGPGHARKRARTSYEIVKEENKNEYTAQPAGISIPWQNLPYQILLSIFDFASRPLVDKKFQSTHSVPWLLRVALICRTFAEPALSALYYSPPLFPPNRAHALRSLLSSHSLVPTFNYGAKIKYLDVEASTVLLRRHSGLGPVSLEDIIAHTPQLRGISFYESYHTRSSKGRRFAYITAGRDIHMQNILRRLETVKIALREWTWDRRLTNDGATNTGLYRAHKTTPFQTLVSISLVNYEAGTKHRHREQAVGEALSFLSRLKCLTFRSCDLIFDHLMPLLPDGLEHLEIVECPRLKSPGLQDFLTLKGNNLKALILDHNRSLNLSFLTHLAQSCPLLELLKMDLRYFSTFVTFRDSNPKYTSILDAGEVPSWPQTLRSLELHHLRKWNIATAELFFSSLTGSAGKLPDLRLLKIRASLEESSWRDRVGFRDKWTQRLRHVFLRRWAQPNPHLSSFAAFAAWKKQQKQDRRSYQPEQSATSRPRTRHGPKPEENDKATAIDGPQDKVQEEDSDSDAPLIHVRRDNSSEPTATAPSPLRRSTRPKPPHLSTSLAPPSANTPNPPLRQRRRRRHRRSSSSSEDSALYDDNDAVTSPHHDGSKDAGELLELVVQGMCDSVDVLIDNLRPGEEILSEGDFLDEERSGDGDWDEDGGGEGEYGGEEEGEGEGYAW
ncbi:hypothetical protein MMC21_008053 [Puttea exsequens]|nr:hypothetical protein [Puttea exsequens]